MMHVTTVARGNEVAAVRILARTLAEHHPDWELTVLVLPGVRPQLQADQESFAVLSPADLAARGGALPTGTPAELRAALSRPLLAQRLLDEGAERVLVIPPDAEVLGSLDAFLVALGEHPAVLVPRLLGSLPADGERPDARDLLEAGEIDDELVAVRADETGRALVDWWADRAREAAADAAVLADAPEGASGARLVASPLGAAVRAFPGVHVLEDAEVDVSYWNLHERPLDGARLLRWQGFRADRPWWLSDRASRTLVLDDALLTNSAGARAAALRDAGWIVEAEGSGSERELPNGLVWNQRMRRLHAQALDAGEDFGDVYSPGGAQAFAAWLTEPAPQGAITGVNRYGFDVWRERRDVREVFRDLDGPDGESFVAWLWQHGRSELGLEEALLPPLPSELEGQAEHVPPVLLTGYLRGQLGLGAAARGYAAALRAAGVPVATATIVPDAPLERRSGTDATPLPEREFEDVGLPPDVEPEVNLVCVNADQVPAFVEQAGEETLRSRYTIGQWAWETDVVPAWWDASFELVDEVWVYSSYVAENLARATDVNVPVVVVPLPVTKPDPEGATVPLDLPDGFLFLFAFDFFSTVERKNPVGLVEAFKHAFERGEGPTLLLKTSNACFRPEARERLRHAIGDRADILLVDALLEPAEMAALFERADSYVSLHRAEGFGLTLAESMALGKPVIATGFSGNTDFMTPANSYLVDWTLTDVGPDAEHYPEGGKWAEPSLDHAAAVLREVHGDPDAAAARGARAAADIAAWLTPEVVGAIARDRLVRIGRRRRGAPPAPAAALLPAGDFEHRLEFDLGGGDRGGPKGAARRALFRALRPYTASERELDRALAGSVRRLALELHTERSARAREQAQVRRQLDELGRLVAALTGYQEDLRGRLDVQEATAEGLVPRVDEAQRQLEELMRGARAAPYMAGEGLGAYEHERAGRVLGFRREAPGEEGDAYRRFEDVFRGSRERVAELIEPYVALLDGHGPVLDVGCGRGELLERLKEAGIEASGVDADAGMAEQARAAGLDVAVGDGLEHLESLAPGSLGAITAIHVIEDMPADELVRFFRLARERLRPGGLLVCETINPHAVHALKTYWVDRTHHAPVFPEVAVVMAEVAGFRRGFMWFPRGTGDAEADRFREDAYAVVAEV